MIDCDAGTFSNLYSTVVQYLRAENFVSQGLKHIASYVSCQSPWNHVSWSYAAAYLKLACTPAALASLNGSVTAKSKHAGAELLLSVLLGSKPSSVRLILLLGGQ